MHEWRLQCPEERVEILSEALEAFDAVSVSVEDADAQTDAEQALFGEPGMPPPKGGWARSRVVALFAEREQAVEAERTLSVQDFFEGCRSLGIHELLEQDWVRLTQSQFEPVAVTETFWVVPTWHTPPPQALHVIRLDPGLAFGTGTHPTTQMCLRWLTRMEAVLSGAQVLDYGCGSGILAIGAAKLGAGRIVGVDIDQAAVQASLDNAQANAVNMEAGFPDRVAGDQFDVVLANILATPLKVLAPLLCAHVRPGGHLVLAGILERQAEELQEAYAPTAKLSVADLQDGWVLMTAQI